MIVIQDLMVAAKGKLNEQNAVVVVDAVRNYGGRYGLDQPHRQVHLFAQLMHESAEFRYDTEIWGPTAAQKKYDTRKDLGNTPEVDGDGKLYLGRTSMQLTGRANYRKFTRWARENIDPNCPDFEREPARVLEAPWEGLVPIWYWDEGNPTGKSLNRYADENNIEQITKKINGGLNGYADRISYFIRLGLVVLGFKPDGVAAFQEQYKVSSVDNDPGPVTRAAIHKALGSWGDVKTTPSPVIAPVAVAPAQIDKPVTKTTGFIERLTGITTAIGGLGLGAVFQDWRIVAVTAAALVGISIVGLILHKRIVDAVKYAKEKLDE